jgi:hypothetical protein
VDLDPADGVAPSFSWLADQGTNIVLARTTYSPRGTLVEDIRIENDLVTTSIFAANSASASGLAASADAVSSLESFASTGSASQFGMYTAISVGGPQGPPNNILLGPHTELIVSARARLLTHDDICPTGPLVICDSAYAEAFMLTARVVSPNDPSFVEEVKVSLSTGGTGATQNLSQVLSVTLTNASAQSDEQFLRADTGVTGAGINEIPEPATYALLAVGLGTCVGLAKLRARRP